jgi:hypothetical protein
MANRIDLVALIPHRLCTTKRGKYPGPELRPYAQVSVDWQRTGANADFWGFGAAGLGDSERLYEIRGMMAGIGEQLGLACLAHHEVSNWMALGKASRHRRIAREMSSRALVELQAHYVLAIGHAMVNLAGRVVALDGDVRSRLVKEFKTDFPPYSNERRDWIQISKVTPLSLIAKSSQSDDLGVAVAPVLELAAASEWKRLEALRGQDFHRWRSQSAGIRGAAPGAFGSESESGVRSYQLTGGTVLGEGAPASLARDNWQVTVAAMERLVASMRQFELAMLPPIERLTSLSFNGP